MIKRSINHLTVVLLVLGLSLPCTLPAQTDAKTATYTITEVRRYNIEVVRIAGQGLTVDVEGFGRRRFQVPRGFTFDIDGKQLTLNQLRTGQKLRAYVTQVETGELMLLQDEQSTEGVLQDTETEETDISLESEPDTAQDPLKPDSN